MTHVVRYSLILTVNMEAPNCLSRVCRQEIVTSFVSTESPL
jgi:hypothetical protein